MRNLRKDKKKLYVSKRLSSIPILDQDNNFIGEYAKVYDNPTELFLNIKPISNDTERQIFGDDTNKILKISYTFYDSQNFEIVNYSAVWIDVEPNRILTDKDHSNPMNNNYLVIRTINLGNQNVAFIKKLQEPEMKVNILSLESVNSSINKLRNYQRKLESTSDKMIKNLTKKGYEYMISIVPEDTGNLKSSITWKFDKSTQKGTITVGTDYWIFVEYGTGIVGKNSPHPNAKGWKYDVNNHGQKGWWYFDNKQNRFRWTKGRSANAFIYKTVKLLENGIA